MPQNGTHYQHPNNSSNPNNQWFFQSALKIRMFRNMLGLSSKESALFTLLRHSTWFLVNGCKNQANLI